MKKYIYSIFSIALLALSIANTSCSNDDEYTIARQKSTLLQISTEMVDTRAVKEGPDFAVGDSIGLWVRKADGTDYAENSVNVKATFNGSSWELDRKIEITEEAGTALVYAYYPYTSAITSSESCYSMEARPNDTDYMYSVGQQSVNDSEAKLAFSHVMSRLSISVVGSGKLTWVSISGKSIYLTGSFVLPRSMAEKPCLDVDMASSGTIIRTCSKNLSSTPTKIDLLIFPTQVLPESDVEITLAVDGNNHTYPITDKKTFKSGVNTPIYLQCGNLPEFIDNGDGTGTLNGHEWVDLGVKTKDGKRVVFATKNIGAETEAEAGYYFRWGELNGWKVTLNASNKYVSDAVQQPCLMDGKSFANGNAEQYNNDTTFGRGNYWLDEVEEAYTNGSIQGKTDMTLTGSSKYYGDAATYNWGEGWMMMSSSDFSNFYQKNWTSVEINNSTSFTDCTYQGLKFRWTQKAIGGLTISGEEIVGNNHSLFFPAVGCCYSYTATYGQKGSYWGCDAVNYTYGTGTIMSFEENEFRGYSSRGYTGRPIRPMAIID